MRIMDWNIEHMNSWWKGGDNDPPIMHTAIGSGGFSPAVTDVEALAMRVGNVINAVDPDIVTIQEGAGEPEMEDFFDRFVNGNGWKILRGAGGAQALIVAARLDRDVSDISVASEIAGEVDLGSTILADIDANAELEEVNFTRKPQVVNVTAHDQQILLLNNHLKSKYVQQQKKLYEAGGEDRIRFFEGALKARRRISAEAFRIREFLDKIFTSNPMAQVIVTGDLNDGAGADSFERQFLTHSVVDRIFGSIFDTEKQLTHVLFHGDSTDFTAQFYDFIEDRMMDLVLDHIGISQAINMGWTWRGWVAVSEFDSQVVNDTNLNERDRQPSDHRPVIADLTPIG